MEKKINKLFMKNKYNYFWSKKLERIEFFKKYWLDICELYKNIEKLFDNNYDKFEDINYAFGKLESILNVCQFLRKTQKEKNHDTDKKIIFELVSLSESIYSLIKQIHNTENLIKWFFRPVKEKLKINIRPWIIHATHPIFENSGGCIGARILYLMRNDYVHNINFTWKVFLSSKGLGIKHYT